jgi:hypothetical protein
MYGSRTPSGDGQGRCVANGRPCPHRPVLRHPNPHPTKQTRGPTRTRGFAHPPATAAGARTYTAATFVGPGTVTVPVPAAFSAAGEGSTGKVLMNQT